MIYLKIDIKFSFIKKQQIYTCILCSLIWINLLRIKLEKVNLLIASNDPLTLRGRPPLVYNLKKKVATYFKLSDKNNSRKPTTMPQFVQANSNRK
jgi:hypothetical protein